MGFPPSIVGVHARCSAPAEDRPLSQNLFYHKITPLGKQENRLSFRIWPFGLIGSLLQTVSLGVTRNQ